MCTIVFTYVDNCLYICAHYSTTQLSNKNVTQQYFAPWYLCQSQWHFCPVYIHIVESFPRDPQSTNWPVQAEVLEQMHLLCSFWDVSYKDVIYVILFLNLFFSYTVVVSLLCMCISSLYLYSIMPCLYFFFSISTALCGVCVGVLWVRVMKTSPLASAPFLFITQVGPLGERENNWKLKLLFLYNFFKMLYLYLTEGFSVDALNIVRTHLDQQKWGRQKILICNFCHFGLLQTCSTCLLPLRIFLVLD